MNSRKRRIVHLYCCMSGAQRLDVEVICTAAGQAQLYDVEGGLEKSMIVDLYCCKSGAQSVDVEGTLEKAQDNSSVLLQARSTTNLMWTVP